MSVNLGTVHVSLEMRLQKLKDGIRGAKQELSSLESDTKRRADRIGQTLTGLGRSMSLGITAPLVLMGKSAIQTAVRMDSLTRSLTSLTGNSKETEKQLIRLREAAKLPGLGFNELIEGSVRLQSAGLSARQAESALKGFGNALALAGGSKEDLREVGVQLSQIASSGKLQGDELRIIAERVPQVRAVLKEAFGTASSEEIMKFGLSVEQILGTITTGLEKLPQATDSVQNKFDNFNDTLDDLKRSVGGAFLPAVTDGLELMARKTEEATKWFNELEPAAKEGLGKLALGGAIMGPALIGLGALSGWFAKLSASPFFKWLLKSGTLQNLGPGVIGGLLPESSGARQQRLFGPDLTEEEKILGRLGSQRREIEEQRRLFPFGIPKGGLPPLQGFGVQRSPFSKLKTVLPPGVMIDPLTGVIVPIPKPGIAPTKTDWAAIGKAKKAAEEARKKAEAEAKRRAEFGAEYGSEVDIEVLELTPGRQYRAQLRQAEKDRRDAIAKGAKEADADRFLAAKKKAIWAEYFRWWEEHQDKLIRKGAAEAELIAKGWRDVSVGGKIGMVPSFGGAASTPNLSALRGMGGPKIPMMPEAWKAFGRLLKMPPAGTLSEGQAAQGQEFLAGIEQLAELDKQRKLDALLPGFKKPIGDLFDTGRLAQELKPKVTPFTFELGKHLGDNLAMEMGREFGMAFDKVFGTGNPLSRALSNTLSRLVDDLMYSLAQRALGSRLILSLFGGGAAGAAGGAAGMTGAALMGGGGAGAGAAGAAGGAKAAGLSAGAAWSVGFAVAATWGFSRVMNSIFKGSPAGKANLQARFSMDPGFRSQSMQLSNFSGMPGPVNIYFPGAQFNNDQDPKRAASRMAWHVQQQMRSRPGS